MLDLAWDDPEYQHIFLVPLVALFLAWVRRGRLKFIRVTGNFFGPLLVAAGWVMGNWGLHYHMNVFFHIGALLVVIGCLTSVLGTQTMLRFFPVIVVLFMMVPLPGQLRHQLADPLQHYTAEISGYLLGLAGADTRVYGNSLVINNQPVFIAEACNGMRMVFPLLLIAYGFAFALPLRTGIRFLIVILSPVVALLCNVVRVLPIVWLQGQGKSGQNWGESLHEHSGWFMVPIAFLVLLGLIRLLKWTTIPVYKYPLASQST